MSGLEVALAGAVIGMATLVGALAWVPYRDRLLRARHRETVVVTTHSGAAYSGVLFDTDSRTLVLRNAQVHGPPDADGPVSVDGELLLARGDVEFLQRPGSEGHR